MSTVTLDAPIPGTNTLLFEVRNINEGGPTGLAFSASVDYSTPIVRPVNTSVPFVTGTMKSGQTVTTTDGTWDNSPTSYAYSWLRCDRDRTNCTPLTSDDATDNDNIYTLTNDDIGHRVRSIVTATNPGGSSTRASRYRSVVTSGPRPANIDLPALSGIMKSGETVTTTDGTWSDNPTSYSYGWLRCDQDRTNCTTLTSDDATDNNNTYTLINDDIGHRVRPLVTATNPGGSSTRASSYKPVVTPGPKPVNTSVPVVTGTMQIGQTVTTTDGTWDNNPTSYSYGWLRCDQDRTNCTPLTSDDATDNNNTYTLTNDDIGHRVRSLVTATNPGGSTTRGSTYKPVVNPA